MIVLSSLNDAELAELLLSGAVGVIPTDTIYGLAAKADSPEAVAKIGRIKRSEDGYKPGTVVAANAAQLIDLGVDAVMVRQVEHLWPNSLSIELPIGERLAHLYQDGPHRAFRVVAHPELKALLEKTGPLLTTSANIRSQPPANNIREAQAYFGDEVAFYVDGGDLSGHPPSTIVRLHNGQLQIVRQGAVTVPPDIVRQSNN